MAQPIKYNTGAKVTGCCIKKGNYNIGVITDYQYGPTSSSGFYAGYPPGTTIPVGGFVSYQNKSSQGPSIYNIPSVNDLVYFGTQLNIGTTYDTPEEVIAACIKTPTIALVNIDYPELPLIDNNILTLDAGYTSSYPWTDPNWFDVAGGTVTQASLSGETTFISGNSAYNYSDSSLRMPSGSVNSWADMVNFGTALQSFTLSIWVYFDNASPFGSPNASLISVFGQLYSNAINYAPQTNCNFLIRGVNNSPRCEGVVRIAGTDYTVQTGNINTNTWNNIVLTYNGSEIKIYNAQAGGSFGTPNTNSIPGSPTLINNGLKVIIGGTVNGLAGMSGDGYFGGDINSAFIWNTALEESELGTMFNAFVAQRGW
jgi:hypothetical protein